MSYLFPYPASVDKNVYQPSSDSTLFGLPSKVIFCSRCVNSNQVPASCVEFKNSGKEAKNTVAMDDSSVCDACLAKEVKDSIDWTSREEELWDLCNKYRKNDGSYDCLVPGSGGKDSFMQAHLLKYKYHMNPLTITWAPSMYTDWGRHNHQAWIDAGFDNILITPNGLTHRLITRIAVDRLFHPFQPFILGQKGLAPKLAAQFGISLIFYGENEAEYHNPVKDMDDAQRSWDFFTKSSDDQFYLGGASLAELAQVGITKKDLNLYFPVNPDVIVQNQIEVHYLGYYIKWHPQGAYYYAIDNSNFRSAPERTAGTYSTYNSLDDKVDDFHYHTTFIKFGVGRATYDAAQEVRSGDITREEAIALVKKYDGEFPQRFANEFFEYLSLSDKEFPGISEHFEQPLFDRQYYDLLCDKNRSPHLWSFDSDLGWTRKHTIFSGESSHDTDMDVNWSGNRISS